ncbi:unnamed protein product [Caenorhabditis angaria]|uniref:ZZ-type domain-containing protein n=1 Tax=Caenorhabditis angaria TaxID=860376 RepID=A0A9P1N495_9PELO|nr:unnamed protein product [Caenorhabditis angaria]
MSYFCSSCFQVIEKGGHLFSCNICPDFNLCAECEKSGKHLEHGLLRTIISNGDVYDDTSELEGDEFETIPSNNPICSNCDRVIRKHMFKCQICNNNFVICDICENQGIHPNHPLLRIAKRNDRNNCVLINQAKFEVINLNVKTKPDSDQLTEILKEVAIENNRINEESLKNPICSRCNQVILTRIFKCTICQNSYYCDNCENQKIHSNHPLMRILDRNNANICELMDRENYEAMNLSIARVQEALPWQSKIRITFDTIWQTVSIEVYPSDPISVIQPKVLENLGCSMFAYRAVFNYKSMKFGNTFRDYEISNGSKIYGVKKFGTDDEVEDESDAIERDLIITMTNKLRFDFRKKLSMVFKNTRLRRRNAIDS